MIRATMLQIIPTRALKRVNPDWLPKGEAELNERLEDRRGRRTVYSEVQR